MVEAWTGTILDVDEPSNTDLGYHGGNEIDRLNKLLNGVNLTTEEGADVTINTNWYFYDNKLRINDGEGHSIIFQLPPDMETDKTLVLPYANATLATSISATPNDFGENMQQFRSNFIKIKDADNSHGITLKTSGLSADWPLLFPTPGHVTDEEVIYSRKAQTLYDKTLSNPTLAAMNFFIDSNVLKHSTTNANGDLLFYKSSVTKYDRLPRGTAGQFLRTSLDGTFIEWASIAGGGAGDITGAANVGSGSIGVFRDEVSGILNFKRLLAGSGITLTNNANDISIAAVGGGSGNSATIFKNTTMASVANTTTETNILNTTLTAGLMGTNGAIHIVLSGWYKNDSGGSDSMDMRLKLGGTIIWQDESVAFSDASIIRPFHMEFWIKNMNSASSQHGAGWYMIGHANNADVGISDFALVTDMPHGALTTINSAINTASSQSLQLSVVHGDADPELSLNAETLLVELIT